MSRTSGGRGSAFLVKVGLVAVVAVAPIVASTMPVGATTQRSHNGAVRTVKPMLLAPRAWGKPVAPVCPTSAGTLHLSDFKSYSSGGVQLNLHVSVDIQLDDNTAVKSVTETYSMTAVMGTTKGDASGHGSIGVAGSTWLSGGGSAKGPQDVNVVAALKRARSTAATQAGLQRTVGLDRVKQLQKPGKCVAAVFLAKEPVGYCAPPGILVSCATPGLSGENVGEVVRGTATVPATWTLRSTKFGKASSTSGARAKSTLSWSAAAQADPVTDELVEATYLVKSRAGRANVTLKVLGLRQVRVQVSLTVQGTSSASMSFGFSASTDFVASQRMLAHGGQNIADLDYSVKNDANWHMSDGTLSPPSGCDTATVSSLATAGRDQFVGNDPASFDISANDNARVYDPSKTLSQWAIDLPLAVDIWADTAGNPVMCTVGVRQQTLLGFSLVEPITIPGTQLPGLQDLLRQTFPHSPIGAPVTHDFSVDLNRIGLGFSGTMQVHMTLTPQQWS